MSKSSVSRRGFMGGAAAALGYMGLNPASDLSAKEFSLEAMVSRTEAVLADTIHRVKDRL